RAVYSIVRWKNVLAQLAIYKLSRTRPGILKKFLRRGVERMLPPGYDVDTHFTPRYNPWDQRLCLVPDADLFKAIGDGSAEVVTDRIAGFDEAGIELESGARLDADVVVTATGLNVLFLGDAKLRVDGVEPDLARTWVYKGMMLNDIPNFAFALGYTNASWTLKADLVAEYACRLLNQIDAGGYDFCVPEVTDPSITEEPLLDFNSGYVLRALDGLPKQGSKEPWKLRQSYPYDLRAMRRGPLLDGTMQFRRRPVAAAQPAPPALASAAPTPS
ncbi:MAG TPA: NAD(P)/FAD-dependent oxidoreductase, partial [Solirubrobacterales bacterium]|nr:NAD(P)/FAD-dependent oxidoreductase [Solirubrobacterales bacterium]